MGVQIQVVGTRLTTITDEDGAYQIANVPVGTVDLQVRMIGYSRASANATLTANLPLELNFEMRQSVIALEAVVVTGAGAAVEKKQLGNTVATLDMSSIETAPVQNFSEALAAREPSVSIGGNSGFAGSGASIRIRGASSLSMSNEPVVYVDGVRIDNGTGFGSAAATSSRLDDISPESIDHIEILKGAAAATLYGSEASAGVIQIFTKRGSASAPRFSFRIEQGISRFPGDAYHPNAGFGSTQAEVDHINEVYGQTPGWTDVAPYEVFERTFVNDVLETGHQQTYSGSVTGGGESINYFVSGRFNRDNGPIGAEEYGPARDISRMIQGTANITVFPRQRLSFRLGTMYSNANNKQPPTGNSIYAITSLANYAKPENAYCDDIDGDGTMDILPGAVGETTPRCAGSGSPNGNSAFSTVREAFQSVQEETFEHFNGNLTASYQAADRLNIEATFGLDVTNGNGFSFKAFHANYDHVNSTNPEGSRTVRTRHNQELTVDLKAIWDERLGSTLSSQFTAGAQGFISTNSFNSGTGTEFPGPGLEVVGAAANQSVNESWLQVVNTGLFAQEQIGYNDYAYMTVGGRWDRNSAFGENTGGAFYPKVSLSIIPSDMPGWSSTLLSTLRIRGALGKSGLQPGAFDKFTTYQSATTFMGAGLRPDNLGNEDLGPEKSTEIEVGAELGLFNNIMGLEATLWQRNTKDALVDMQFPISGGFTNLQLINIGELRGRGAELKFDWNVMDKQDLSVSMFATASYIKEEIRSMGTAPPIKVQGSYIRIRNYLMPPWDTNGDGTFDKYWAPGSYFGAALVEYTPGTNVPYDTDNNGVLDTEAEFRAYLEATGSVDVDANPMQPKLRDDDGDGDFLDTYLGKPDPDWTGSFGLNLTFMRNLDLNTLFEFRTGEYFVLNLTDAFRNAHYSIGQNTPKAAAVISTLNNPATSTDDKFDAAMEWANELKALSPLAGLNTIQDAKFLALREISLAYRAPTPFAQKLGLSNLTFALSGRNLLKFTPYQGIDQESNLQARAVGSGVDNNYNYGLDAFGTPIPRRFTASVQFGF